MYRTYLCKMCRSDFILMEDDIKRAKKIKCPYCQSTHVREEGKYENLRTVMKQIPFK